MEILRPPICRDTPHLTWCREKNFGEQWTVSVTALNVADVRVLLDNSYTFRGTHYNLPRQVYGQVRYRFHF